MTMNGVMAVFASFQRPVAFSVHYVKVVEDIPKLSATNIAQSF